MVTSLKTIKLFRPHNKTESAMICRIYTVDRTHTVRQTDGNINRITVTTNLTTMRETVMYVG